MLARPRRFAAAGARQGIKDGAEFVIPTTNRPEKANKEESVAPAALSFWAYGGRLVGLHLIHIAGKLVTLPGARLDKRGAA
ncbi:hypothetical protein [Mesorhizobium sp. WSM4904]|uniref:hypothetical protein n=1 Tax=Mesorhizobium sp. WSM4904 TaxID=3038545 RepID=UPI0024184CFD|nr:hypothetical protein [Mesorhizobium sp. WSM4904]WFP64370.1 hypothetical protein QAZ47_07590 [Mesorhizobium sp. WSM4904]